MTHTVCLAVVKGKCSDRSPSEAPLNVGRGPALVVHLPTNRGAPRQRLIRNQMQRHTVCPPVVKGKCSDRSSSEYPLNAGRGPVPSTNFAFGLLPAKVYLAVENLKGKMKRSYPSGYEKRKKKKEEEAKKKQDTGK